MNGLGFIPTYMLAVLLPMGCASQHAPRAANQERVAAEPGWDLPAGVKPDSRQSVDIRVAAIRKVILWDNGDSELPPDETTYIDDDAHGASVRKRLQWQGFHVEPVSRATAWPNGSLWDSRGRAGEWVSVKAIVITGDTAYAVVVISQGGGWVTHRFVLNWTGRLWEVVDTGMLSVAC